MGNLYIEMARLCSKSHIGQKDLYVIKRNVMYAEGLYMEYGRGIHIGRNSIYYLEGGYLQKGAQQGIWQGLYGGRGSIWYVEEVI